MEDILKYFLGLADQGYLLYLNKLRVMNSAKFGFRQVLATKTNFYPTSSLLFYTPVMGSQEQKPVSSRLISVGPDCLRFLPDPFAQ